MASFPKVPADLPYPKLFFQKGVNFTAEFPDVYASEGARRMLELLPQNGVNAIALVPYGWSSAQSAARAPSKPGAKLGKRRRHRRALAGGARAGHEGSAEARGLASLMTWIFLRLPDRAAWFDQYRRFLEHYVQLAKRSHADLFCVGGELVHLTPYDSEWRKLISRVRQLYPGPLVYAANFGRGVRARRVLG